MPDRVAIRIPIWPPSLTRWARARVLTVGGVAEFANGAGGSSKYTRTVE